MKLRKILVWVLIIGLFITAANDCNNLEKQLEEANKIIEENNYEKVKIENQKDIERLTKENEKLKKDKETLQDNYKELQDNNEQLEQDKKDLQKKIDELEIKLEESNVKIQDTKKENHNESIPPEIANVKNEEIISAYNNLPENVKELFRDLDCTLYEVDTITSDTFIIPYGTVAFFSYEGATGECKIQFDMDAIEDFEHVVYHEFGHLLDCGYNLQYESDDYEFIQIYHDEKNDYVTDYNYMYATGTSVEYCADAFAEYMKDPEQLKENTPKTYEYIHNSINNIR